MMIRWAQQQIGNEHAIVREDSEGRRYGNPVLIDSRADLIRAIVQSHNLDLMANPPRHRNDVKMGLCAPTGSNQ